MHRLAALDAVGQPLALHPAGDVDCVTPQIVDEFMPANHPRHHRTAVNANADVQRQVQVARNLAQSGGISRPARATRSVWSCMILGRLPTTM
jgi:hypothetical protein